jgi:hypothetical protein
VDLLTDPGISCVGFDSAGGGHLRDEQPAGLSIELIPNRRSSSLDARAFSVCPVADDLG